jgi:hypothetical protein
LDAPTTELNGVNDQEQDGEQETEKAGNDRQEHYRQHDDCLRLFLLIHQ